MKIIQKSENGIWNFGTNIGGHEREGVEADEEESGESGHEEQEERREDDGREENEQLHVSQKRRRGRRTHL